MLDVGWWRIVNGCWMLADGGCCTDAGCWRCMMADGCWRTEDGRCWRLEEGASRMHAGGWKKEDGGLRMADGGQNVEDK